MSGHDRVVIDHLVYATPDLDATVADLARQGLTLSPGGAHDGRGTRNALADLGGGAYLEVLGPDPDQREPAQPRPSGIDGLTAPCLAAWAVRVTDLDAAVAAARSRGYDPGTAQDMARLRGDGVRLAWRLTPIPATRPPSGSASPPSASPISRSSRHPRPRSER